MSETLRDKVTATPEGMRDYLIEEAHLAFTETVAGLMREQGCTPLDLWRAIDLPTRRFKRIMDGRERVSLEVMVAILHHLGHKLVLTVEPLEKSE